MRRHTFRAGWRWEVTKITQKKKKKKKKKKVVARTPQSSAILQQGNNSKYVFSGGLCFTDHSNLQLYQSKKKKKKKKKIAHIPNVARHLPACIATGFAKEQLVLLMRGRSRRRNGPGPIFASFSGKFFIFYYYFFLLFSRRQKDQKNLTGRQTTLTVFSRIPQPQILPTMGNKGSTAAAEAIGTGVLQ